MHIYSAFLGVSSTLFLLILTVFPLAYASGSAPPESTLEVTINTDGLIQTYSQRNVPADSTTKETTTETNPGLSQASIRTASSVVAEIETEVGGLEKVTISSTTGLATFLSTRRWYPLTGFISAGAPAENRAKGFVERYGAAFGIADAKDMRLVRTSQKDEVGMEHVRFQQTHKGVPVTGGEIHLHLKGGNLVAANAKTLPDLDKVDTKPKISSNEALAIVRDILEKRFGILDVELSAPRLEILNRGLLEGRQTRSGLAWFIEATKIDMREFFWIDAVLGTVALQFSQLTDAKNRNIHDANDPGDGNYDDLPGNLVRSEGGPAVVGAAAADANAAYDYSGDTYDYFMDEHGRDSYDGAGAELKSTVRFCPAPGSCPYQNAFWNGTQMVYGAGFPAADDVDGHELTHAVTEFSANLFYYMQSGALNESYSDIFGETVDLTNSGGTDTPAVRWEMGEDVPVFGAIRDMMDPTIFDHPGKMSDSDFQCLDSLSSDSGGVHSNSGVPNHAYALMVDGGTYNSISVTGMGLTKAGKIQYRALTRYLTSASGFLDNYNALKQSCQDLIGVSGISEANCTEVTDALDAVEMSDPWPCSPSQASIPSHCPVGQAPDMWHFEDFESSAIAACPQNDASNTWCRNTPDSVLGAFATSGDNSLWGFNRPTTGTILAQFSPAGNLPANARMQFSHSFGFENNGTTYYDGGIVQHNSGAGGWTDSGPLISAGQEYINATIFNDDGNPLGGQSAFAGDSWGYTATQLDLSTLSGETFGYRFNIGTDSMVYDLGWFIDDIRIYTCSACLTNRTLTNAHNGTASLYQAGNTVTASDGFAVGSGEDVSFIAGSSVHMGPGFSVQGGTFAVAIDSVCGS